MTEKNGEIPAITNLSKKEKAILNDTLVKFHVITNVLDYLAFNKFANGNLKVSYANVIDWLDKRATAAYDDSFCVTIKLWIYEMVWLDLISIDAQEQKISFTENGLKAYKNQQFHLAYANMLQAKSSSNLARAALWIAVSTFVVTAFGIIITLILK